MYIAILGRQPTIGMAELERVFGDVSWFSDSTACIETESLDITRLGGTLKAGRVVGEMSGDWRRASEQIVKHYSDKWSTFDGKLTLGISAYGFKITERDVQKTGIILKQRLKARKISLRLIPNTTSAHNTATSHHNKLGLAANKVELLVIRNRSGKVIIAESVGAQNITSLAARDQGRPKRDAFVGMLPPKLAQIMVNLAAPSAKATILDPFCGTGVILQEAALLGYTAYGTDLSDKMVDYSTQNMEWLSKKYNTSSTYQIEQGDAMNHAWQSPINAVICEGYLGQPFSAPPSNEKLGEVRRNCNHIMSEFLKNIGKQIVPGTPLCLALPAWNDGKEHFAHLPLLSNLEELGYRQVELKSVNSKDLLYYRPDQVVGRDLLILEKI